MIALSSGLGVFTMSEGREEITQKTNTHTDEEQKPGGTEGRTDRSPPIRFLGVSGAPGPKAREGSWAQAWFVNTRA